MNPDDVEDVCPRPEKLPPLSTTPLSPPIYPSSVWHCADPDEADQLLGGGTDGYVYQRDRHPNADMLAAKCRQLHAAQRATITASGMAALALAMLSQTKPGDRILISRHVYGKTLQLMHNEAMRWGLRCAQFDPNNSQSCEAAFSETARLVVVETISNPRLYVANIRELAERAHGIGALLLVDNTFASPVLCRPLALGADLVMESLTKMMNGHSDVVLGLLCGADQQWSEVARILATWGFASSPWDCWLVQRGIASLHLRMDRASANALAVARMLAAHRAVAQVDYPGLPDHPHHQLATEQFQSRFGSMVTFHLAGGRPAADVFIKALGDSIPFCPSLGEISTTLSHPQSTSHRAISDSQLAELGISGGTIRLSCGVESAESILRALDNALESVG